jgi:hypothetical protein
MDVIIICISRKAASSFLRCRLHESVLLSVQSCLLRILQLFVVQTAIVSTKFLSCGEFVSIMTSCIALVVTAESSLSSISPYNLSSNAARVNVALSRARHHLLVVGNGAMLMQLPLWSRSCDGAVHQSLNIAPLMADVHTTSNIL